MENFAFVKGTEVRNLLFFGLLPNLDRVLSMDQYAHLAMYVCAMRLLHSGHLMGENTGFVAGQLLDRFHQDHELFYHELQTFKLHLHSHYATTYRNYGSFANLGCFGQESFIGFVSDNYHQVRYYGDAIVHYFSIDFSLQNAKQHTATVNGPLDQCFIPSNRFDMISTYHNSLCDCDQLNSCCKVYRRYSIHEKIFHSLIYTRRMNSVSYFVRYRSGIDMEPDRFGMIDLFFTCNDRGYAAIMNHRVNAQFSDRFKESSYYRSLRIPIDYFYHLVEKIHRHVDLVPVDLIINHCIIVEQNDHLLVTDVLSYDEHD